MKTTKLLVTAIISVLCSSQLLADNNSVSDENISLQKQIDALRAELSETQAILREVSKIVMTERLDLTVHVLGNNRYTLEGKGLNGRDLGGKELDGEKFMQVLKSIIEEYPKPKLRVANPEKYVGKDREDLTQLVIQAGIFSISLKPTNNP